MEIKKHVYFIEGADNVGKTTTIQNLKQFMNKIKFNSILLSKYPTYVATNTINKLNNLYKENESECNNKTITISDYTITKISIIESLINTMIGDMSYSFNNIDKSSRTEDVLEICDRGFLSTYLYQYREMLRAQLKSVPDSISELNHLKAFINKYLPSTNNDLNVIILNNNINPFNPLLTDITIDKTETIEYKRDYDNNIELQSRINNSLNNIIELIQEDKLQDLLPIKFYYINIFDDTGSIRKTSDEICNEITSIINKEE